MTIQLAFDGVTVPERAAPLSLPPLASRWSPAVRSDLLDKAANLCFAGNTIANDNDLPEWLSVAADFRRTCDAYGADALVLWEEHLRDVYDLNALTCDNEGISWHGGSPHVL